MQCMDILHLSIVNPSSSQLSLKHNHPSKFYPRTRLLCCSRSYHDEDGGNSIKTLSLLPSHVKTITSTSNPFVKHCVKLRESSSYRHSHGSVLLVGSTPIRELCSFEGNDRDQSATIECLLVLDTTQVSEDLSNHTIRRVTVSPVVMKKLCGLQSTDSIEMAALIRIPSRFHKLDSNSKAKDLHKWFPVHHRILVLDGIQDPGNLGTLLRSAIAFRWDGVYLLSDCCDPFNDKALRASRGASFQLPIVSGDWAHLDMMRKNFHMKILAGHLPKDEDSKPVFWLSKDYADSVVNIPLCLVLGSEGSGLSERSREECELVSIPMAGEFESLNVSVAGGIFLYMLQPQKR
ncbi:OLC1v1011637C1 [Oldenlandia corymbosa var. corymbosa]|uniref:OLC1v1011637C1 n=1 Tax=Oldenlandia corymbosa var. corymbosa TaxID=529605 RepID=A0AAV1DU49_OLDCO|nr:OLC1v1011637C1 [Oldenlandia corymbosa var. corymbosa]